MIDIKASYRLLKDRPRNALIPFIADLYNTHASSRTALIARLETRSLDQLRIIALLMTIIDHILIAEEGRL